MSKPYCKVEYCRFQKSHTTKYHSCGTCNQKGHGQVECGNLELINALTIYDNDTLDISEQCTILNCPDKTTHTNESHICLKCGRRHSELECIIQDLDLATNIYHLDKPTIEAFFNSNFNNNKFIRIYIGMGCQLYICRKNQDIMTLFMHQDCHGQYGPATDDTPILNEFLNGYIDGIDEYDSILDGGAATAAASIDINKFIKCPMCRKDIDCDKVGPIFGTSDKCSICMENNVEVYFPECGHATICKICFETLKKEQS
jgi:hypothetical protein